MKRPRLFSFAVVLGCAIVGVSGIAISGATVHVLIRLLDRLMDRVDELPPGPIEPHYDPPPYPNAYWNRTAWVLDPSNTSTCASDNNDCSQTSCGPGTKGPCVHYSRIARLWGNGFINYSPQTNVDVTFTLMSGQIDVDPIIFRPVQLPNGDGGQAANGQTFLFLCSKAAAATTTISTLTAKNALSNQPLQVTFGTAPTMGEMIENTTHPSIAWQANGNALTDISQPVIPGASTGSGAPITVEAEVNTWAPTDAITIYTLPQWQFVDVEPMQMGWAGSTVTIIQNCYLPENHSISVQPGDDKTILGNGVQLVESYAERNIVAQLVSESYSCNANVLNSNLVGGFNGGPQVSTPPSSAGKSCPYYISAGGVSNQNVSGVGAAAFNNVALIHDVALHTHSGTGLPFLVSGYSYAGAVETYNAQDVLQVTSGGVLSLRNETTLTVGENSLVWGGGKINANAGFVYYALASIDAGVLNTTTLQVNGGTTGCCTTTGTVPTQTFCGPINPTNLGVLSCSDAGLNNQAFAPTGGGYQGF